MVEVEEGIDDVPNAVRTPKWEPVALVRHRKKLAGQGQELCRICLEKGNTALELWGSEHVAAGESDELSGLGPSEVAHGQGQLLRSSRLHFLFDPLPRRARFRCALHALKKAL